MQWASAQLAPATGSSRRPRTDRKCISCILRRKTRGGIPCASAMSVLGSGADFEALLLARGCALMVRPAGSCVTSVPIWCVSVREQLWISGDARSSLEGANSGGRGVWAKRPLPLRVTRVPRCGRGQFRAKQPSQGGRRRRRERAQAAIAVQHQTAWGEDNGELAEQRWKRLTPIARRARSLSSQVTLFRRRVLH